MAQKQDVSGDEDYEEIEDESLVLVELTGIIDTDFLRTCSGHCKFVGIDSGQPVLQMDRYIFTGQYEDTVGTCVVFEEDETQSGTDDSSRLRYMCHTAKKLSMTRSFLTGRNDDTDSMAFLNEENPYHQRAIKIASSCGYQPMRKDKSVSDGTTLDHAEEPNSSDKAGEAADDVEMTEDGENIETEELKDEDNQAEDRDERTQPEDNAADVTTVTVDPSSTRHACR